ncbi:hypothetical protein [Candidatus Thiothrix anitrata]|uniref:Uncharacterized protein n=1 Tax=Candidatus Thiothrix anitrata TaxID=2823902 RepID=A0ABX7X8N8_9GAMM|nr:hypothetical protein [Candidatus Thiothrix anitrata]QTR51593.1 hypothetical protein J8380_08650 [Candidatus Thiothrix anitrata]
MVAQFKVSTGDTEAHPINRETVEYLLAGQFPWFQRNPERRVDQYFAVCPWCNNPVQLKGLYRKQDNSPHPYGSHTGKPINGFFHFNAVDMLFCPYKLKQHSHKKNDRRAMGEIARRLIKQAVEEFDRIVLLLRDDFGFPFSNKFAEKMLDGWFSSEGYLYTGAHLRNLPWMIAYFGPTESLYGQYIGKNSELTNAIREQVYGAKITGDGQLTQTGERFFKLQLQCLHHRFDKIIDTEAPPEYMTLWVKDFSKTNFPEKAPTIYQKTITFDSDRFERLIHTASNQANRNAALLQISQTVADRWRI